MGAVRDFTDRNLSLPTSEQLLLVRMVLEPFLLAWMGVGAIASCLDGIGAVASCSDGV